MAFDREATPKAPTRERQTIEPIFGPGSGLGGLFLFLTFSVGGVILAAGGLDSLRDMITENSESFVIDKEKLSLATFFTLIAIPSFAIASMLKTLSRPGV